MCVFVGTIIETTLEVIDSHRPVGIRLAANTSTDKASDEQAHTDKDTHTKVKGSKKKSAQALALKQQRDRDEAVIGVFIHKSSLAYRTKHDMEESMSMSAHTHGADENSEHTHKKEKQDGTDEEADKDDEEDEDDNGDEDEQTLIQQSHTPIEQTLIESRYKVGSCVHRVRIVGYNLVEGLYIGSNMSKHTQTPGGDSANKHTATNNTRTDTDIVHWSQVRVGMCVPATVQSISASGLSVLINNCVRAHIPRMHTSDAATVSSSGGSGAHTHSQAQAHAQDLGKKFKVGQRLRVRVWEVSGNQIIVTNKQTLVKDPAIVETHSEDDDEEERSAQTRTPTLITSFESAYVGWSGFGVCTHVSDSHGLRIHFYNKMKGCVPARVLSKQGIFDVCESYRVGQLVRCVCVRKLQPNEDAFIAHTQADANTHTEGTNNKHRTLLLALEIGSPEEVLKQLKSELKAISDADITQLEDAHTHNENEQQSNTNGNSLEQKLSKLDKHMNAPASTAVTNTQTQTQTTAGGVFAAGVITTIRTKEEYFIVSLDDGRVGRLPFVHCFDFVQTVSSVFASYKHTQTSDEDASAHTQHPLCESTFAVGKRLEHMLVIDSSPNANKQQVYLSLKPLLLHAASNKHTNANIHLPATLSEVSVGDLLAGTIIKIDNFGLIVRFMNSLIALLPRSNVTDKFLGSQESLTSYYNVGDSVCVCAQKIDAVKEKIIVTCRPSLVHTHMLWDPTVERSRDVCFLNRELEESFVQHATVLANTHKPSANTQNTKTDATTAQDPWLRYGVGSIVTATVQSIKPYGVILIAPDNHSILIARGDRHTHTCAKAGDRVSVCVLDVDYEKSVYEVSMNTQLVSAHTQTHTQTSVDTHTASAKKSKKASKQSDTQPANIQAQETHTQQLVVAGQVYADSVIELLTDTHMIVSVPSCGHTLAVVGVRDYHCPYLRVSTDEFNVGDTVSIRVASTAHTQTNVTCSTAHAQSVALGMCVHTHPHSHLPLARIDTGLTHTSTTDKQAHKQSSNAASNASKHTPEKLRTDFLHRVRLGKVFKWSVHTITHTEITLLPANHTHMNLTENISTHTQTHKTKANKQTSKHTSKHTYVPRFKAVLHVTNAINQSIRTDNLLDVLNTDAHTHDTHEEGMGTDTQLSLHPHHPFAQFSVGQELMVKVLQMHTHTLDDTDNDDDNDHDDEEKEQTHTNNSNSKRKRTNSVTSVTSEASGPMTAHTHQQQTLVHVGLSFGEQTHEHTQEEEAANEQTDNTAANWSKLIQWNGKHAVKQGCVYAGVITQLPTHTGSNAHTSSAGGANTHTTTHPNSVTVSLSPYVHGTLAFADVSAHKHTLKAFPNKCFLGQTILVCVHKMNSHSHENNNTNNRSMTVNRLLIEQGINEQTVTTHTSAHTLIQSAQKKFMKSLLKSEHGVGALTHGFVDVMSAHTQRGGVARPPAVCVQLPLGVSARVCVSELTESSEYCDYSEVFANKHTLTLPSGHTHGQFVKVRLLSVSTTNTQQSASSSSASVSTNTPPHTLKVEASLRPSRVSADNAHTQAHTQTHTPIPEEGSLVQGFVCNVSASGCFIRLAHDLTGVCLLKELSDTFVHNPKEQFPVGKLVQARVLSVSASASASSEQTHTQQTHNIKLSLKTSAIEGDAKLIALYNSFEVGSIVEGTVKQVTDFGVFVTLSSAHTQTNTQKKSNKKQRTDSADRPQEIVGLSRKMHAVNYDPSHEQNVDLTHTYKVGDVVQAKILSVNPGTRKIALGLKPSYFKDVNEDDDEDNDGEDDEEDEDEDDMDEQTDDDEDEDDEDDDEDDEEEEGNIRMLGSDEEDDDGDYEDEELERMIKEAALHSDDDDDDEEDEEEEPVSVQKKKKSKKDEPAAETSSSKKRKAVVASAVVSDDEEVSVVVCACSYQYSCVLLLFVCI
jgi:ribosomal protein S1